MLPSHVHRVCECAQLTLQFDMVRLRCAILTHCHWFFQVVICQNRTFVKKTQRPRVVVLTLVVLVPSTSSRTAWGLATTNLRPTERQGVGRILEPMFVWSAYHVLAFLSIFSPNFGGRKSCAKLCLVPHTNTQTLVTTIPEKTEAGAGFVFAKCWKGLFCHASQPASSRTNVDCVARYMEKFFATGKLRRVKVAVVKYKIAVFIARLFPYPVFFQSPSREARRVKLLLLLLLLLSCSCVSLYDSATVSALGMLNYVSFLEFGVKIWNLFVTNFTIILNKDKMLLIPCEYFCAEISVTKFFD